MTTAAPRSDERTVALPDPNALRRATTDTLDRMEAELPALPAASVRFPRAVARRVGDIATGTFSAVRGSVGVITDTASTAGRTVAGTARWAAEQTARTAETALRTVWGQTAAQAGITTSAVARARDQLRGDAARAADDAARVVSGISDEVDPAGTPGPDYDTWTKDQLYAQAQAFAIEGRSSMTKDELITAIRAA